jgi:hypothetical protein
LIQTLALILDGRDRVILAFEVLDADRRKCSPDALPPTWPLNQLLGTSNRKRGQSGKGRGGADRPKDSPDDLPDSRSRSAGAI